MIRRQLRNCATALLIFAAPLTQADEIKAAVAANFTATMKRLAPVFERTSGHKLVASFGATGQLYAQINNGAPFDVLLAADDTTPQRLVTEGNAIADSNFIYARGRLALWSSTPGYVDAEGAILKSDKFSRIAIANPKAAPYGRAAIDALTALQLLDRLQPKFVTGENIAQTQQFVSSGNVPLGFIALAQVKALAPEDRGSYWVVPSTLHKPIDQGAVLLKTASGSAAARAFLAFLKSPEAIVIIRELGYETPAAAAHN
ncbi:MAG: molybdate ABC transporter substrate-binding protein [Spongiibacteraceae bacterium]